MTKKKEKLNQEEKEILKAFEERETISVKAGNTKLRTKPVNIRLSVKDLNEIQKKAEKIGLPYQTLINLLIHQYNQGKIKLII